MFPNAMKTKSVFQSSNCRGKFPFSSCVMKPIDLSVRAMMVTINVCIVVALHRKHLRGNK